MSCAGVCCFEVYDDDECIMCRSRRSPRFGSLVLVSLLVGVCPLPCKMFSIGFVGIYCSGGFGSAPFVRLVSTFIICWFGSPMACVGVCFTYICDASGCITTAVVCPFSCRVTSVCVVSLQYWVRGTCWHRPRGRGLVGPGLLAEDAKCPPPLRGGR